MGVTDAPLAQRGSALAAAAIGAASVALGAGVGELVAAVLTPAASPFAVVGSALIDLAPAWAKDAAIALFGTADKLALLGGILLVVVALGAAAGLLDARWPPWGRVLVLALAAAGVVAALTRSDAGALSWVPSAVSGVVAAIALWGLGRMLRSAPPERTTPREHTVGMDAGGIDRRRLFAWAGGVAAIGVLAAIGGTALRTGTQVSAAVRRALRLPAPAVTAAPVPAGADLGVLGLAPVVTPAEHFYRIDTALIVPDIAPADWSLRIHGLVDREVVLTWEELLRLPLEESWTTLVCVSNPVGGDLIGNAKWLGHPIRNLLDRAGVRPNADMVLSRSQDGFTASTPLEVLTDPERAALLALGMNGEPLPPEHGFPVRMVVPGLYGYVSATKWVTELQVTRFDRATAYWTDRGWSAQGPVKLQSRIDVPRRGQGLSSGDVVIAGVAWQPHVGIARVEVQVDGGTWREATLAPAISDDTWVQWSIPWTAEKGDHAIRCRATNARGETQTDVDAWPAPDGATGWQQLNVTVA